MRTSNVDEVSFIQVVKVRSVFGAGIEDDPFRTIIQYWSLEGKLLATSDPWLEEENKKKDF